MRLGKRLLVNLLICVSSTFFSLIFIATLVHADWIYYTPVANSGFSEPCFAAGTGRGADLNYTLPKVNETQYALNMTSKIFPAMNVWGYQVVNMTIDIPWNTTYWIFFGQWANPKSYNVDVWLDGKQVLYNELFNSSYPRLYLLVNYSAGINLTAGQKIHLDVHFKNYCASHPPAYSTQPILARQEFSGQIDIKSIDFQEKYFLHNESFNILANVTRVEPTREPWANITIWNDTAIVTTRMSVNSNSLYEIPSSVRDKIFYPTNYSFYITANDSGTIMNSTVYKFTILNNTPSFSTKKLNAQAVYNESNSSKEIEISLSLAFSGHSGAIPQNPIKIYLKNSTDRFELKYKISSGSSLNIFAVKVNLTETPIAFKTTYTMESEMSDLFGNQIKEVVGSYKIITQRELFFYEPIYSPLLLPNDTQSIRVDLVSQNGFNINDIASMANLTLIYPNGSVRNFSSNPCGVGGCSEFDILFRNSTSIYLQTAPDRSYKTLTDIGTYNFFYIYREKLNNGTIFVNQSKNYSFQVVSSLPNITFGGASYKSVVQLYDDEQVVKINLTARNGALNNANLTIISPNLTVQLLDSSTLAQIFARNTTVATTRASYKQWNETYFELTVTPFTETQYCEHKYNDALSDGTFNTWDCLVPAVGNYSFYFSVLENKTGQVHNSPNYTFSIVQNNPLVYSKNLRNNLLFFNTTNLSMIITFEPSFSIIDGRKLSINRTYVKLTNSSSVEEVISPIIYHDSTASHTRKRKSMGVGFQFGINLSTIVKLAFGKTYNFTMLINDSFTTYEVPVGEFKIIPYAINLTTLTLVTDENNKTLVNTMEGTNSTLDIKFNQSVNGSVSVALYGQEIRGVTNFGLKNISKYYDIEVAQDIVDSLLWALINASYTDADITNSGVVEPQLRIYSFNNTENTWQICSSYSQDVTNNWIACNTTHFSVYGIFAESQSSSSGSSSSQDSSGSGGGSSGGGGSTSVVQQTKNQTTENNEPVSAEQTSQETEPPSPTENESIAETNRIPTGQIVAVGVTTETILVSVSLLLVGLVIYFVKTGALKKFR